MYCAGGGGKGCCGWRGGAATRTCGFRYLAVVHSADGWRVGRTAKALGCCESTAKRARSRNGARIRPHFLPPYCPDDNRIERRVWREMHANVTTNHEHRTIQDLMDAVTQWLKGRNRGVSESREAI